MNIQRFFLAYWIVFFSICVQVNELKGQTSNQKKEHLSDNQADSLKDILAKQQAKYDELAKEHQKEKEAHQLAIEKINRQKQEESNQIAAKNDSWLWMILFLGTSGFILGFGLIFFFYKTSQKNQKTNRILSSKVAEKTEHLMDAIHKLEETNRDLDTFLYKASHDLKGPLTTLDGLCNIGLMELENEPAREYLQMQKKVIYNLQLLLFRIVEIGNIRHHENHLKPIKLKRLFHRMTRSMHRAEGFDNVNFIINIGEDIQVETDPDMLEIALDNVLKNALQHANYQKYRPGEVSLEVTPEKEHTLITIKDNGQGILPELQHRIFEMFFRGTDYFKGFGLGLYKAKIAMRKIGGEISLKSSKSGETIFLIKIPKNKGLAITASPLIEIEKSIDSEVEKR
jgi:signal transduction histidine kinase